MKYILSIFLLFFFLGTVLAQENPLWIIKDKTAGSDILYRPNDFFDGKINIVNLFISGNKGDKIISPVDGTITHISYGYLLGLERSISFNNINKLSLNDSLFKEQIAKKYNETHPVSIDPKFIHFKISIYSKQYGAFSIWGLNNPGKFITGQKIRKGEVLGELGFCYSKIEKRNVKMSRSVNNKSADPMSIFGLKSTYRKPSKFIEKDYYEPDELKADFEVLKEAILEGYPGLGDYISRDSVLLLYDNILLELDQSKTPQEFESLLRKFINHFRDNHFNIKNTREHNKLTRSRKFPITEILLGVQSDSLFVIRTNEEYSYLLGKHIVRVDGIDEKELIAKIRKTIPAKADGFNQSRTDCDMLLSFYAALGSYFNKTIGDSLYVEFADGSIFNSTYKLESLKEYKPYFYKRSAGKNPFLCKNLQDTIAYLDINTFKITQQIENEIKAYIQAVIDSGLNHLIIDLRGNPGGHEKSLAKVFSFIAQKSFKTATPPKVNSNKPYNFAKNTYNLIPGEAVFPKYSVKKEDGYYLPDSLLSAYYPDKEVCYKGEVYVLTDAFSFSAASLFAAMVKKYKRGIIIGQETGGAYYHMNALKFANIMLSNTNTEIMMPLVKLVFEANVNKTNPWGRGVMPNIHIPLTTDEFTNKDDDVFLLQALDKISKYQPVENKEIAKELSTTTDNSKWIVMLSIGMLLIVIIGFVVRKYKIR